jgi:hypothetical protein
MFLVLEKHEQELSYEAFIKSSPTKSKSIKKERGVKEGLRLPPIKKESRKSKIAKVESIEANELSYERKRALSQLSDTQETRSPPQHQTDLSAPYSLRSRRGIAYEPEE